MASGDCEPMVTLTVTPTSEPVSPEITNPSLFSAMFTVSSPAMSSRFGTRVSAASAVTVAVTATSL